MEFGIIMRGYTILLEPTTVRTRKYQSYACNVMIVLLFSMCKSKYQVSEPAICIVFINEIGSHV